MFNDGGRMKDIYCGNPTCQYCGATYGIAELHNCAAKQEALRKRKEESIAHLEKELSKAQITLRDQFAMAALTGLTGLNWRTKETSEPTAKDHAIQAYKYADAMLAHRNGAE